MHPRATNLSTQTRDVLGFGFESTGALELDNEYSGFAAERKTRNVLCLVIASQLESSLLVRLYKDIFLDSGIELASCRSFLV